MKTFSKSILFILVLMTFIITLSSMSVQAETSEEVKEEIEEETVLVEETKTAIGLANFVLDAYEDGWEYCYGSFGQLTSSGTRLSDCSGLIFAYLCWTDDESNPIADYTYPRTVGAQANASSTSGSIDTIPRTHGLLLTTSNNDHVGVYIGNDMSIDNSTYSTDMVLRTVSEYSSWIKWYKLDCIEYPTTGWYEFDGSPFYYMDGEYMINVTLDVGGVTYTFDEYGTPSPTPENYLESSYSPAPELESWIIKESYKEILYVE